MKLSLAQPEDKKTLAKYYRNFDLTGLVDLKIDRCGDFFRPYDCQSDDYWVFALRERDETLGVATFVIENVFLEGQLQKVALGRDLRISNSRRAIMGWAEHFLPVMNDLKKNLKIKHFFSILNLSEVRSLNAFVRPRKMNRPIPRFYLYRRFNLVSLHGQLPLIARNPLPHLQVVPCTKDLEEKLVEYLIRNSIGKNLAQSWNKEELLKKIGRFPGLSLSNFLVALDENKNIIGSMAPWSSLGIQNAIPLRYSLRAHNFRQFLKFGQLFGWTRALTKPVTRLKKEMPLNFRYLLFLNADNADIFEAMLWRAYKTTPKDEFLVYLQTRAEDKYRRPLGWIAAKMPYGLYALVGPNEDPPEFLSPRHDTSVEMEPFYL